MSNILEPFEVVAGKPVHGGAVLATAPDERKVFIRGALPGEKVCANVLWSHKKYLWAQVVEVLEPSPHRVEGIWPDAVNLGVGGIELSHASLPYQRLWKKIVLAEQIGRLGSPELQRQVESFAPNGVEVRGTPTEISSEESNVLVGSRTRIQLVGTDDGRLGMRQFRSNQIVAVREVPIAVKSIRDISQLFSHGNKSEWKRKWKKGERISVEAPTVGSPVVTTSKGTFGFPDGEPVSGLSKWSVTAENKTNHFWVNAGGFWQSHRDAPPVLVETVFKAMKVEPGQNVLEFYSGSGLFTKFLAEAIQPDGHILSLEGNIGAVANAHKNLLDEVKCGTVELYEGQVDGQAVKELWEAANGRVDTALLDPPRKGVGSEVARAVAETNVKRVVLVSCDPASGVRDLNSFLSAGFKVVGMFAWDIFPHSHHFETVTELIRC